MITLKNLTEKIENRISEYIEFDVKDIFKNGDQIAIYGGAVRDSLADLEIHDVDIICMPYSAVTLSKFLKSKKYQPLDLVDVDSFEMYKGISLINEPWTYMNNNKKIIQIIRPVGSISKGIPITCYNLLKEVDISSCGVFLEAKNASLFNVNKRYNKERNFFINDLEEDRTREDIPELILKESCRDAIVHCLSKVYEVNECSRMYSVNRLARREHKLQSRGWTNYNHNDLWSVLSDTTVTQHRKIKMYNLNFKPEYDYKIWTTYEYEEKDRLKYKYKSFF